jgi:hypothetical protein
MSIAKLKESKELKGDLLLVTDAVLTKTLQVVMNVHADHPPSTSSL